MFLGLDYGTSEVKALLLDAHHRVLGSAGVPLSLSRPQPGWSEQRPDDWWAATLAVCAELRAAHAHAWQQVQAIGLSGQMHGAVLLDAADHVLRPAILWNDTRAEAECVAMMDELPALPMLSGCLAMPGFTAPKLRWLATHEPRTFERVAKVLLPKDFIRLRLTGEHVTDASDASGTTWLDVARRDWSDELLALTGLARTHMPRLVEGSQPGGTLLASTATTLGLRAGIVVAGGAGDNAASAIGMGIVRPGMGFLSLGTSGVIFVATDRYRPNPRSAVHAYCHALPGQWHQMSVMLSAASCLRWARQLLGRGSDAEVEAMAAPTTPAQRAAAPLFLPYLGGERTPHNSATLRASLHGLGHDTDAAAIAYAVMEGVAFGLADGHAALQAAGTTVQRLSLVGGGARSALWAQMLADVLGVEIATHADSAAGGALGAARLGWMAAGGNLPAVCTAPVAQALCAPDAQAARLLAQRLQRFRALSRT
ncbi:xylulokinase [Aquincola sp. J276]|uniref:xylulokinase n=1 Tax=Aquincola sp. J276 TaxID=2898432 RepID=UPI002150B1CA|nr:xylulokinase [Aquincola sp. J276]MCR5868256.1 xylulokinase [Aquincola sp. J276]